MTDAEQIAVDVKVRALVAAVDDLEALPEADRLTLKAESQAIRITTARLVRLVARL